MKILLVGSGGREHSLAWTISGSPLVDELYCAPGNGGIAEISTLVDVKDTDIEGLVSFAKETSIDFVVVGPEAPLTAGLVDQLDAEGISSFGPSAAAAQLEGSKGFMKDLCADYDIPTAAYQRCYSATSAKDFLATFDAPYVIKADGLAAGKGVIITESLDDAETAVDEMFSGSFGEAGEQVVIEEFMDGEEASFLHSPTEPIFCHSSAHRTTSGSARATLASTRAAWAPIPRRQSSTRPCRTRSWSASSSRQLLP